MVSYCMVLWFLVVYQSEKPPTVKTSSGKPKPISEHLPQFLHEQFNKSHQFSPLQPSP